MKVVFIHGKFSNSWESLACGYMGAYLHQQAPTVEIDFFHGNMDSEEKILSGCQDADIVAFSCTSPAYKWAQNLARQMNAWTVLGGYHASALGLHCTGFNQIVQGEGEEAMVRIVAGNREPLLRGRPMLFDELPWPDRSLIANERHIQVAFKDTGKRITSFQAHRGCPFACRYCADGKLKVLTPDNKGFCRQRNVQELLDEIAIVTENYSLDLIKFCDPTWNTRAQWVVDFCAAKIRRGIDVPFFANIHARNCHQDVFQLMAKAGCRDIGIGVESGSEQVLEAIGKGVTKDHIRKAVQWAKQAGIHVRGYFIVGMPNEGDKDLQATEAFAEELTLDEYGFTLLCPYPGTDFYDGSVLGEKDWTGIGEYQNDFWRTDSLTNGQLRAWQNRLVAKFSRKITWHQQQLHTS